MSVVQVRGGLLQNTHNSVQDPKPIGTIGTRSQCIMHLDVRQLSRNEVNME